MRSILFVCLGNICRSPTAEGLMLNHLASAGLADRIRVDSAGIGGWHAGEPPDRRAIAAARKHGVDLTPLRARQVRKTDFSDFDLIVGMDRQNVDDLRRLAPKQSTARIGLWLTEALGRPDEVPDPYYEDDRAFDAVFDLCDRAARAFLEKLRA
ncbi:Low molecular weight protein-tyrosine-phosphatase YfkJ [Pleomorphomonas sp. T1.2MG-36]|uniref:low molecular weight protein-tyrosine-phosphatase n=1 Tax=Pleomorphomonas sp. T1.2MG-36 TaxID=3041167 RepID=UPI002477723D|nr:low molecular weight protein-tyrosine-phosphatase [Pleomorphomonas sp. T1.2MG-36]CAI9413209.1 Low molecular weight protein-tyrosine-phosphatase YfkJ [Pleomorphomonas sp. T1.2MG-36]